VFVCLCEPHPFLGTSLVTVAGSQIFPTRQFHRLIYMTPVCNEKLLSRPIHCCTTHNKVLVFQAGAFVLSFLTKFSETLKTNQGGIFFLESDRTCPKRIIVFSHERNKSICLSFFGVSSTIPTPACPHVKRAIELCLMNSHWMGRTAGIWQFRYDSWFLFFWHLRARRGDMFIIHPAPTIWEPLTNM